MPMTAETLADLVMPVPATDVLLIERLHDGDEQASERTDEPAPPQEPAAQRP